MRLEPLYRTRFTYPEGWDISLGGEWEQHFYIAEGRCEGAINGASARRTIRASAAMERSGASSDATIMFEWHGYGRAYPAGRRQVVGAIFHSSDDERYVRLNDVICVCAGEVRASAGEPTELVIDVAEFVWEAVAE